MIPRNLGEHIACFIVSCIVGVLVVIALALTYIGVVWVWDHYTCSSKGVRGQLIHDLSKLGDVLCGFFKLIGVIVCLFLIGFITLYIIDKLCL